MYGEVVGDVRIDEVEELAELDANRAVAEIDSSPQSCCPNPPSVHPRLLRAGRDVALCPLDHSGECTSAPGLDRLDQVHDAQRPVTHIADDLAVDLVLDDRQQLSDADRVESEIFEQAKASRKVVRCLHIQLAKRERPLLGQSGHRNQVPAEIA